MRTPRSSAVVAALARVLASAVALTCGGVAAAAGPTVVVASAGALVRATRAATAAPAPSIVVLRAPSVADRVAAAGGEATEAAERAWSADAFHAQEAVLARLARAGASVRPDRRFTRALDGFSASLTAVQIAALESDPAVAGVYPSRRAFALPIARPRPGGAVPGLGGGGGAGVGVATIGSGAAHAAALGASVTARAPGAVTLPVVVKGPPTTEGLLAALERAVDPDGDGDCHDAARIILLGVIEPLAALPDAPSVRAVAGAAALDVVVVVPVGESGPAGSLYGSLAGPAGSPAALTVAAGELRAGAVRPAAGSSAGLAPGSAGSFVLAPGRRSADAAAAVAAEAALLLQARPGLGSRTVRAIVEGSARLATLAAGSVVDLAAALAAEVAVELSPLAAGGTGTATVRNVSSRPLRVTVAVEGAGTVLPRALALPPGAAARVVVRVRLPGRAAGEGAGEGAGAGAGAGAAARADSGGASGAVSVGALVVTPEGGPVARARWVRAVPRPVPLLADVALTPPPGAALSDATPARLSVRAGAVLGAGATRQLRPLARLDVELWSSTRRLGLLARLRDVLPGRYVLALTGRGPGGARLAAGRYGVRVIAVPADTTPAQRRDLRFTVG